MELIFKGEVYEALPDNGGLIFSYFDGHTPEGDLMISFKMLGTETKEPADVHRDVYKLSKFGANYAKILKHCQNYVTAKAVHLNEGKVFVVNTDGTALLFDGDGEPVWQGILKYKNRIPADITVASDGLWGTFPDLDCLVRFNAATMRNELRLGKKGELFNAPKGIFAEGDCLYVSSFEGKKVLKVNLKTYEITELYKFSEEVYSYFRLHDREFALLKSGIYEI